MSGIGINSLAFSSSDIASFEIKKSIVISLSGITSPTMPWMIYAVAITININIFFIIFLNCV